MSNLAQLRMTEAYLAPSKLTKLLALPQRTNMLRDGGDRNWQQVVGSDSAGVGGGSGTVGGGGEETPAGQGLGGRGLRGGWE